MGERRGTKARWFFGSLVITAIVTIGAALVPLLIILGDSRNGSAQAIGFVIVLIAPWAMLFGFLSSTCVIAWNARARDRRDASNRIGWALGGSFAAPVLVGILTVRVLGGAMADDAAAESFRSVVVADRTGVTETAHETARVALGLEEREILESTPSVYIDGCGSRPISESWTASSVEGDGAYAQAFAAMVAVEAAMTEADMNTRSFRWIRSSGDGVAARHADWRTVVGYEDDTLLRVDALFADDHAYNDQRSFPMVAIRITAWAGSCVTLSGFDLVEGGCPNGFSEATLSDSVPLWTDRDPADWSTVASKTLRLDRFGVCR